MSKPEVDMLVSEGYLEEKTSFGNTFFRYCLERQPGISALSASYSHDKITMTVPEVLITNWSTNNIVGFNAHMPIGEGKTLYLLLEKDFKCLDNSLEDQSDNFENPNKTC